MCCGGVEGNGSVVSSAKMRRWAVVWQCSTVLLVASLMDFGFFTQKRHPKVDCFTVPMLSSHRFTRSLNDGWRAGMKSQGISTSSTRKYPISPYLNPNPLMSRRFDNFLLPMTNEIVKEHAKLVQDINSLKQVVFISPLIDEFRDYDDSIFHETIETSTTIRPIQPPKPVKTTSIPIILLGGESQNEAVKTQPVKYPKPIRLVGTSVSPLRNHPYPFVMQAKSQRPFKVCMQPMSLTYTTQRPSLLQRLINSIIPR